MGTNTQSFSSYMYYKYVDENYLKVYLTIFTLSSSN